MGGSEKTKILYIAGNGRSGSTLLDAILGQLPGFFNVGELRRIWDRGMIENRPCGCGLPFNSCEVWQTVLDRAFGSIDGVDPYRMVRRRDRCTQTKHLTYMLRRNNRYSRRSCDWINEYVDALGRLYESIAEITECRVIVDASKWPTYLFLLDSLQAYDVYVLHWVRDPRAVAFSWTRRKTYDHDQPMPRQGALKSTAYWITWNWAIRKFWDNSRENYLRVRYEDFMQSPRDTVQRVVQFMDEDVSTLPFTDPVTVNLKRTHAVAGNIARLSSGPITLRLDDEWDSRLGPFKRGLVTLLTWPWLDNYAYR